MHTPTGLHTPRGQPAPGAMYKFPSVSSIHSMVSMGVLPPGHGYVPKKPKPDKPYGPSFVSVMNRTWRGPGRKYINYALFCLGFSLLFYSGGALYFGHRNVTRLRVLRTEVLGALMVVVGILCTSAMFHFIHKARMESNRWRRGVKFQSQGMFTAAAVNYSYVPEEEVKLASGTYGSRALKEIPRPKMGKRIPGLRSAVPPVTSQGRFEKKKSPLVDEGPLGKSTGDMYALEEGEEPMVHQQQQRPEVYAPPERSTGDRSFQSEKSSGYEQDFHDAPTMPREPPIRPPPSSMDREPVQMSPGPRQMMPAPSPRPMIGEPMSGPPMGLPRPQPQSMPPVHRPAPQQVFRPSPMAWKAGTPTGSTTGLASPSGASPSGAFPPRPEPQKSWTPPVLPPVQRAPVTTLKSPQPTIQLSGATPKKGPMGESEL